MADIRDEHGNPIQLTDEHGNPVVLTDEHGNPMWLTGVATQAGTTLGGLLFDGDGGHDCASDAKAGSGGGHGAGKEEHEDGGSTSSFEENEDEQQRRKKSQKKKGLAQKIKEKLIGVKHKEEQPRGHDSSPPTTTDQSIEHVKKSPIEKIDVKMPDSGHRRPH